MENSSIAAKALTVIVALGVCCVAHGGPVFDPISGTGTVVLDLTSGFDINGHGAFLSAALPSNAVVVFDPGLPHPGNMVLFGTDANTASQVEQVIFLLAGASVSGADLLVPGLVKPVTSPITDAGLAALQGTVRFDFVPSGQTSVFNLASITSVPEPGAALLTLLGIGLIAVVRRRALDRRVA